MAVCVISIRLQSVHFMQPEPKYGIKKHERKKACICVCCTQAHVERNYNFHMQKAKRTHEIIIEAGTNMGSLKCQ